MTNPELADQIMLATYLVVEKNKNLSPPELWIRIRGMVEVVLDEHRVLKRSTNV